MATDLEYLQDRQHLSCICGSERGWIFRRRDRYGLKFSYGLCPRCGHVRTMNPLSARAAERFYGSSDYRTMYFPKESPRDVLLRKCPKPNSVTPLMEFARVNGQMAGTVIEWGCGGGWNLVPFRDAGWNVIGYDYDVPYVQLGRELLKLDLREIGPNQELPTPSETADLVILNHVLEHALDPVQLLRHLRSWCTPRTVVLVGIPLLRTIKTWHWHDFFHVAHIHYFSTGSFADCAREAGLGIFNSDPKRGLFALRSREISSPLKRRTGKPALSAVSLLAGFLEPRFRGRKLVRSVLRSLHLLSIVREAKRVLVRR